MANEIVYALNDSFAQWAGGEAEDHIDLGSGNVDGEYDSAYRFANIQIGQGATISYAHIKVYCQTQSGSGTMRTKTYGIKETNTASFSSNPFGRTKTTVDSDADFGVPGVGNYVDIDVGQQLTEIVGQAGWVSGNAAGFFSMRDGSDANTWVFDWISASFLVVRVSAEPNFNPTPKSISAPTFPSATSHGIKISKSGYDVLDSTDSQLLFTTRKKIVKVIAEGETTTTGGVEKLLAHGLGYTPCVLGFIESGGYRVKLNRDIDGASDPIGTGLQGYIGANDTNISIITSANATVYYYVFIEEQSV